MAGITYLYKPIKCFHCNYLLTVVNSNPDSGESKTKIYCQLSSCPIINGELEMHHEAEQKTVEKLGKCVEVLKNCIKNISTV